MTIPSGLHLIYTFSSACFLHIFCCIFHFFLACHCLFLTCHHFLTIFRHFFPDTSFLPALCLAHTVFVGGQTFVLYLPVCCPSLCLGSHRHEHFTFCTSHLGTGVWVSRHTHILTFLGGGGREWSGGWGKLIPLSYLISSHLYLYLHIHIYIYIIYIHAI